MSALLWSVIVLFPLKSCGALIAGLEGPSSQ